MAEFALQVDLVHPKRLLLPLAEEYGNYPAFNRFVLLLPRESTYCGFSFIIRLIVIIHVLYSTFMISALTGDGVDALQQYLLDQV